MLSSNKKPLASAPFLLVIGGFILLFTLAIDSFGSSKIGSEFRAVISLLLFFQWMFAALLIILNRDPERHSPENPLFILAPHDGYLESVVHSDKETIQWIIETSRLDVRILRSPFAGNVTAFEPINSSSPHHHIFRIRNSNNLEINIEIITHNPGSFLLFLGNNNLVSAGQRIAKINRCSRVIVEISSKNIGSIIESVPKSVIGGETILGHFSFEEN